MSQGGTGASPQLVTTPFIGVGSALWGYPRFTPPSKNEEGPEKHDFLARKL